MEYLKTSLEKKETGNMELAREIRERATAAEQACSDLAIESIRRAEAQGDKVIQALEEIEMRVKKEVLSGESGVQFKEFRDNVDERLSASASRLQTLETELSHLSLTGCSDVSSEAWNALRNEFVKHTEELQTTVETKLDETIVERLKSVVSVEELQAFREELEVRWRSIDDFMSISKREATNVESESADVLLLNEVRRE